MSRLPIRLRVTLAFAAIMAIVLGAVGLFLYLRMGDSLDESVDNGLRSRAGDLSALVQESESEAELGGSSQTLIESEESFAQVLTSGGRVLDSTPQLQNQAVLSPADLERASAGPAFFERGGLPGIEGTARLLATPVESGDQPVVAVVGASLDDRDEALASLLRLLAIGGSAALLLASLAGYGATAAALRPVEAMRRRAAVVSADQPDERLPIPPAQDEISRLGETLNRMLGRLEAARERERRFVDDASHELRTPLALHKTELELALRYGGDERTLRTAIASSIEEVDRLIQLAEDLLVVARSEKGKLALNLERVAVDDLLQTMRDRFSARAAELGRPLAVDPGTELVVEADRLRLEQALTSIVDNALRYGEGDVRLSAQATNGAVAIHVGDLGPGFPPDFLPRAFERFTTGDTSRGHGGSGLGLSIVETIARAHGGRAGATNDPRGGADVWIEVPTDRLAGADRAQPS